LIAPIGIGLFYLRKQLDRFFPFSLLLSNLAHIGKQSGLFWLTFGPSSENMGSL
jgi:hypothetical protein